jgi:hypothetical protein
MKPGLIRESWTRLHGLAFGDGTVESSKVKDKLFPVMDEACSREEKVKQIKRMIQENDYLTDEKLDSALARLLDEIDQD